VITTSKALQELREAAQTLVNPALQEWKKQGGKVVGYFYDYIPEELLTAAGILPFRMRATGSTGTEFADAYFTGINCTYVRNCFDLALRGELKFLDGIIVHNFCDHIRRIYDNWIVAVKSPFEHFLVLPKKRGDEQVELYRTELQGLKKHLEEHFHVEITDARLRDAIKLHNETRRLQREIYQLRKSDCPALTGADTLAIMVGGTAMPRAHYNQLLKEVLAALKSSAPNSTPRARLMLVAGGALDDPRYVEAIESQGGVVVADSMSFGTRAIWNDVSETGDPLTALARYEVIERPACVRFCMTSPERNTFIKGMVKEFQADGVITVLTSFCDQWDFEQINVARYLESEHVPHLELESEYILGSVGQLKTRVQAFMETLK
jgi:bcr-type benzoyl-CoA reductase subunit C